MFMFPGMGIGSIWHLIVILVVVFVVFGAGKLPKVMADLGKGLRHFKDALNDNEVAKTEKIDEKKDA